MAGAEAAGQRRFRYLCFSRRPPYKRRARCGRSRDVSPQDKARGGHGLIASAPASGDDVGQQRILELGDEVFERQLPLLEALELDIVGRDLLREARNRLIEIAVLGLERRNS